MSRRRKEDTSKDRSWCRSNRMIEHDGKWFFHTRWGTIEGPFGGELEANNALATYRQLMGSG